MTPVVRPTPTNEDVDTVGVHRASTDDQSAFEFVGVGEGRAIGPRTDKSAGKARSTDYSQEVEDALRRHHFYSSLGLVPFVDAEAAMNQYSASDQYKPEPGTPVESLGNSQIWEIGLVAACWKDQRDDGEEYNLCNVLPLDVEVGKKLTLGQRSSSLRAPKVAVRGVFGSTPFM